MGVSVLAISVDTPAQSKSLMVRQGLTMPLLSDVDRTVIAAYGVLDQATNIAKPSAFVLDRNGVVRWQYVGQSIDDRPPVELLLAEAEAAAR